MDQDDGQQYDHTEQQRFESEHGIAPALLGGKLELMARVLNKHRQLTRLQDEFEDIRTRRDAAIREYDELCRQSEAGQS